jgi:6-phosphogluconolactonase
MERVICEARALPGIAAERIAAALSEAVRQRGAASLALAGGTTPRAVYELLAARTDLPWSRFSIYFGDERAVPPDHADSNYRMAREALLDRVPVPGGRIHRMNADAADREAAARAYAELLPEAIDVMILGIGEDGHTASLFPGSEALVSRRRVLAVSGPKPPPLRLTLGPAVLSAARVRIVLASGAGKAAAVYAALEGEPNLNECPAQLVRDSLWILDSSAASALGHGPNALPATGQGLG